MTELAKLLCQDREHLCCTCHALGKAPPQIYPSEYNTASHAMLVVQSQGDPDSGRQP